MTRYAKRKLKFSLSEYFNFLFAYLVITYYSLQFLSNGDWRYEISVTIPVSTFTIDLVFENCFLSAMAPYVYSRDGWSLSIYGSECQI